MRCRKWLPHSVITDSGKKLIRLLLTEKSFVRLARVKESVLYNPLKYLVMEMM
jgi:hypothetical protein